jgi:hypothetical protein
MSKHDQQELLHINPPAAAVCITPSFLHSSIPSSNFILSDSD